MSIYRYLKSKHHANGGDKALKLKQEKLIQFFKLMIERYGKKNE